MEEQVTALLVGPPDPARRMAVSEGNLWAMTFEDSPGLPYVRCGRLVRYSPDDLRRWIDSQRNGGDGACARNQATVDRVAALKREASRLGMVLMTADEMEGRVDG